MNRKINSQSNNTDLLLMIQHLNPTIQTQSFRSAKAINLTKFGHLLNSKNLKFNFSQQNKQMGLQWIKKKGGNLNPVFQTIKAIKQTNQKQQQSKKSEKQCIFYLDNLNESNQQDYIKKNFQFGLINSIQSIFSSEVKSKGNLARRTLKRRLNNPQINQQDNLDGLPMINLQIRIPAKREQYIKATKTKIDVKSKNQDNQWAFMYQKATQQKFWQILATQFHQLQSLQTIPSRNFVQLLALRSLSLVQSQLDAILPPSYQNILYYLTNNYLGKLKGQYQSEGYLGPRWGMSFLLYRAGRKKDFYGIIPSPQLGKLFQQADNSIKEKRPKKIDSVAIGNGIEEVNDVFYNQLIYALKGIGKSQCQGLADPNTIDIAWIFLRNVGIFSQDVDLFHVLQNKLYQFYKGPTINEIKIKNLLYVLAYGQIAQIGMNDLMDQDDFLHYLITIYRSPIYNIIIRQSSKKQIVQKRLTQQLIHYIQQLLLQHKQQYVYYMSLIPQSRIVQVISSIIVSSQMIETMDWKGLASKINSSLFEEVVKTTLQRYATLYSNYLQVAGKARQLLKNNQISLIYILNMFIKLSQASSPSKLTQQPYSQYKGRINTNEIYQGQQFVYSIFQQDQQLKNQYLNVFQFFKEYFRLLELIQQRNSIQIYNFLKQSNFILVSQQLRLNIKNLLDKLIQYKGFDCYINFVKNTVKACQIYFTNINKLDFLQQFQNLTLNALRGLIRNQQYSKLGNNQSVRDLQRMLEEVLMKGYDKYPRT